MPDQPNIVFIFLDNLGYGELGVYGGGLVRGVATPRMGALAAEGLRLTNMNMEAQCTPSRSAVMGWSPITISGAPTGGLPHDGGHLSGRIQLGEVGGPGDRRQQRRRREETREALPV